MLSYALIADGLDISPSICMRCCKCVLCGGGGACGEGVEDGSAGGWRAVCCVRDENCVMAREQEEGLTHVMQIYSCAVTGEGGVKCWGYGLSLGDGTTTSGVASVASGLVSGECGACFRLR